MPLSFPLRHSLQKLWGSQSWLQPAFSRLFRSTRRSKSRLKGGCGQDCPPHNKCRIPDVGKLCGITLDTCVAIPWPLVGSWLGSWCRIARKSLKSRLTGQFYFLALDQTPRGSYHVRIPGVCNLHVIRVSGGSKCISVSLQH